MANVKTGRHVRIGRWVQISFVRLDDHAVIRPGVIIARNVRHGRATQVGEIVVGPGAEIGRAAIIVGADQLEIGAGARVEAGAVVTRSVPPGSTVAGVPARIVTARNSP